MADKEERILITKCSGWCHALRVNCDPFDDDDGMFCDKSGKWVRITEKDCAKCKSPVLYGISRAEAVERMTVAMCKFDCTDNERACENCNEWEKYDKCESLAEAALDALLGEKK